ncbi:MAG: peptidoglycan DD-metalloendopeptidase family protein [Firmicutes bacterium]|nr:peptidoglycan DD-metalloendopeptidase family protein [Bacillota bacterium]
MGRKQKWLSGLLILLLCGILAFGAAYLPALAMELAAPEAVSAADDPPNMEDMDVNELREYMKEISIRQERLQDQIDAQEGQISDLEAQISTLEGQMSLVQEKIDATNQTIAAYQAVVDECELEIAAAEERLAERQALLQQRLVNLYVYGDVTMLDVVFGTDSFEDFLSVYDLTQRIMEQDEVLLHQINTEKTNIEYNKKLAQEAVVEQESLMHDLEDEKADLNALCNQYEAKVAEAGTTLEELEALWQQEVAAGEQAEELLRDMISDSTLSFGGSFIWPLPAAWTYVSSEYGWRTHPLYGDQRFHNGIDIPADGGTPLYAVAEGKVIYAEWIGGYGNCVMIDHGDQVVSLYGHLSGYGNFSVGEYVVPGDVIGYVGTTGASTGNHLHFEVRLNGSSTSPWNYLK